MEKGRSGSLISCLDILLQSRAEPRMGKDVSCRTWPTYMAAGGYLVWERVWNWALCCCSWDVNPHVCVQPPTRWSFPENVKLLVPKEYIEGHITTGNLTSLTTKGASLGLLVSPKNSCPWVPARVWTGATECWIVGVCSELGGPWVSWPCWLKDRNQAQGVPQGAGGRTWASLQVSREILLFLPWQAGKMPLLLPRLCEQILKYLSCKGHPNLSFPYPLVEVRKLRLRKIKSSEKWNDFLCVHISIKGKLRHLVPPSVPANLEDRFSWNPRLQHTWC
jgi:hypothetical protein